MTDSQAGAYLADLHEPMVPLDAAVDGVYFEILCDWAPAQGKSPAAYKKSYRCVDWNPTVYTLTTEGFAAQSCVSRLVLPYWGQMPSMAAERREDGDYADWTNIQHWAVWRDHLIGLGAMRCHKNGGDATGKDVARIRWRLSPDGRVFQQQEESDTVSNFRYGGLQVQLHRLAQEGGFRFASGPLDYSAFRFEKLKGERPYADTSPMLARPAPWSAGEYVYVATDISPAGSTGQVLFRPLYQGAAAMLVEPGGRRAYLWIVTLERFWRQYLWDLPAGVTARAYKWKHIEMPPVPSGEPANTGLLGGDGTVWVIESMQQVPAQAILDSLRAGKGYWGSPD
jgi:hypothetical protein